MSSTAIRPNDAASLMLIRRVRSLATIDQVRLVVAALVLFLLVDVVRLSLVSPVPLQDAALITTMDVVGYLAILVALWRPLLGLAVATVPLATALVWTSTSLDALLLTVVPALVLTQQARRNALLITGGLVGYVGLRVLSYSGDHRGALLLSLTGPLTLGLLLGWIGQAVRERRDRAARTALDQAVEEGRIRADERRALSADLHDVVVHHLSTASLQLLSAQGEADPAVLRRTLSAVERANAAALSELRLLVRVLRADPATAASGMEIRELAERIPPTQACAEAQLRLIEAGLDPDVRVPATADALELTVQRTLSRGVAELVDNQVKHAPAGARCSIHISLNEHQATLEARNEWEPGAPEPVPGWGLKGLRERVLLTGGTFAAAVNGAQWCVTVSVPHE